MSPESNERPRAETERHSSSEERPARYPPRSLTGEVFELAAVAAFGVEAIVARELEQLGYPKHRTDDGRVYFRGDAEAIVRTNLWLRSAERVLLVLGEFDAIDFGQLFDETAKLPWEDWISSDGCFPVRGRSIRSQLHSVPDCQSIVKKAIVERLKKSYAVDWFEETGPEVPIEISIVKDKAMLTLDTSGTGLHKRGYRVLTSDAPLKETRAAALIQLSYWNRERPLADPCCGSGTIPIEAALIGRNIAPGIQRAFAAEAWPRVPQRLWEQLRQEARDAQLPALPIKIFGGDIDRAVLQKARQHALAAGVEEDIHFQERALSEFSSPRKHGCVICNPPYGERIGEEEEVEQMYRDLGKIFKPLDTWSLYAFTSHPDFERIFGDRADRRRKLYNATIPCTYFSYFGPPPPRPRAEEPTVHST